MNHTSDQYLEMLTLLNGRVDVMDAYVSDMHDLLEDGLLGDVPINEPILIPLQVPSTRLRPSALAA
jgi:hypothetical protein